MPEGDNTNDMYTAPEQLLAGADHPRPLSPHLRAQLEELLEGTRAGAVARPLPGDVRDKLEVSLLPDEPESPQNPENPHNPEKNWRRWAPRLSVAAAVIIALAILVPTLAHGPGPSASNVAAGTASTRSGLSILKAAAPNASGSKVTGTGHSHTYGAYGGANGAATASPPTSAASSGSAASTTNLAARAGRAAAPAIPPAALRPAPSGSQSSSAPGSGFTKSGAGAPEAVLAAPPPVVRELSPATGHRRRRQLGGATGDRPRRSQGCLFRPGGGGPSVGSFRDGSKSQGPTSLGGYRGRSRERPGRAQPGLGGRPVLLRPSGRVVVRRPSSMSMVSNVAWERWMTWTRSPGAFRASCS